MTILAAIHALSWAVYIGGAITMELVLRHAQNYMAPSQIAVVCQHSGRTYRWVSAFCLALLFATGVVLGGSLNLSTADGPILAGIYALWAVLVGLLALLAFYIHPEMHIRVSPEMTAEEVQQERQRVKRAIVNMDIVVRLELACAFLALALGCALHLL